jgi:lipopolysaccharide export system protein LptA
MNIKCSGLIISILPVLICITYPAFGLSEPVQKSLLSSGASGPINISGELTIETKKNIMVWTGDVKATWGDLIIECKRLEIYYKNNDEKDKAEKTPMGYDRIVATGDVKITQSDGSVATAEKAIYYQSDETLVLSGNPTVKRDNDFMEGLTITLDLKNNEVKVEKAKAVLAPR